MSLNDLTAGYEEPASLAEHFNEKACEIEIKLLKPFADENSIRIFDDIKSFFQAKGWIKLQKEDKKLLTRQLDIFQLDAKGKATAIPALLQKGVTLRVRGESDNLNLVNIRTPDICVKMGKSEELSGALRRGEFEARIHDFRHVCLPPLLKKYPANEFPELHNAMFGVRRSALREFFRIDCNRNRYVIEFPPEVTGLKDKRFVAELLLDDVMYISDPEPGQKAATVYHHDLEVECEILFKACDYDNDPNKEHFVSSPMTQAEMDQGMGNVRVLLEKLTNNGDFKPNMISKAERGFSYLQPFQEMLSDRLKLNMKPQYRGRIQNAFSLSAGARNDNMKNHYFLDTDFGPRLGDRPIARYSYPPAA